MGLGKTIQSVCFLEYLRRYASVPGPSLIVAPLSTIQQWKREFSEWTDMNCVVYWGTEADRDVIKMYEWRSAFWKPEREMYRFHVIVTTYEVCGDVVVFVRSTFFILSIFLMHLSTLSL